MNERGFTLIEVLVAAMILVTAGLVAAGVYARTAQKVNRSIAEAEAASLARAVCDWAPGNADPGTTVYSHTAALPEPPSIRAGLVWRLDVDSVPVTGTTDVYKALLSIALDDDGDGRFDDSDLQEAEAATFVFLLKDE